MPQVFRFMGLLVQNTDNFSAAFHTGNLVLKMQGLYYTGSFLVAGGKKIQTCLPHCVELVALPACNSVAPARLRIAVSEKANGRRVRRRSA